MRKVKYETETERQNLIKQAIENSEILIEDARLTDGNYLVFESASEQSQETIQESQITREQINSQVVAKIRERYSIDEEFKMQRLGMQNPNNLEYQRYLHHINVCLEWGEAEKKKYGL